ncbi:MAG: hypothetical protein KDD42_00380 [Bdellovibrionales bacterium]|nr:hypothetical protein [Bdellovibrionales bacterium]
MSNEVNQDRGEYSDLIAEGIDRLNAEHNFEGTRLRRESKLCAPPNKFFRSVWFAGLLGALALNVIVFVYFQSAPNRILDAKFAERQFIEELSSNAQELMPVAEVLLSAGQHGLIDSRALGNALREAQTAIQERTGNLTSFPDQEEIQADGSVVWKGGQK